MSPTPYGFQPVSVDRAASFSPLAPAAAAPVPGLAARASIRTRAQALASLRSALGTGRVRIVVGSLAGGTGRSSLAAAAALATASLGLSTLLTDASQALGVHERRLGLPAVWVKQAVPGEDPLVLAHCTRERQAGAVRYLAVDRSAAGVDRPGFACQVVEDRAAAMLSVPGERWLVTRADTDGLEQVIAAVTGGVVDPTQVRVVCNRATTVSRPDRRARQLRATLEGLVPVVEDWSTDPALWRRGVTAADLSPHTLVLLARLLTR